MTCWGDPHFPSPTHYGSRNLGLGRTFSISSSSSEASEVQDSGASSDDPFPNGMIFAEANLRYFTLQELKAATQNFHILEEEGYCGNWKIYKGSFIHEDDKKTTIKTVVTLKKRPSEQSEIIDWQAGVHILGRLYHPNIVPLLGFCNDAQGRQNLLVYDFAAIGSLSNHLFGPGSVLQPLPWEIRLKIAIGAARGLAFLHTAPERKIIYRDVKSSNILLDGSYTAKLWDFELAMFGPRDGESYVDTAVMGTYGYADPEYVATGHIYIKSDVYGFGVVLLEILTGSKAMDRSRPREKHNLVKWAMPCLSSKRKVRQIVDPKANYPLGVATQIAQVILKCIDRVSENRPSMSEVVVSLQAIEVSAKHRR